MCYGHATLFRFSISPFGSFSVVAKKLGSRLKIKSRQLKEGSKRFVLLVEVPVVLYQAIIGKNPAGDRRFFSW